MTDLLKARQDLSQRVINSEAEALAAEEAGDGEAFLDAVISGSRATQELKRVETDIRFGLPSRPFSSRVSR